MASELDHRRAAVDALGGALRSATEATISSRATVEQLAEATQLAERISKTVGNEPRPSTQLASIDDPGHGIRHFGPVVGLGNPMSPPLTIQRTADGVRGHATLGLRFEGPPSYVHGGVIAMLMDEMVGQTVMYADIWALTASLDTRYLRAIPLDTALVLEGRVVETSGRKTRVSATIALASDPATLFAEATALMIAPAEGVFEKYFAHITDADGHPVEVRLGAPD